MDQFANLEEMLGLEPPTKKRRAEDGETPQGTVLAQQGLGPYKTQPCKFWPLGQCTKGPGCTFAHSEQELLQYGGPSAVGRSAGFFPPVPSPRGHGPVELAEDGLPKGYKSQLCKHFQNGNCHKGDTCTWAHGEEELRHYGGKGSGPVVVTDIAAIPDPTGRGFKTRICKQFEMGKCFRAEACTFAHGEEELRIFAGADEWGNPQESPDADVGSSPSARRPACKHHAMGMCAKGDQCPFAHGEDGAVPAGFWGDGEVPPKAAAGAGGVVPRPPGYKTQLCKYAVQGTCHKGEGCNYAHTEAEVYENTGGRRGNPEATTLPVAARPDRIGTKLCKFWAMGSCKNGDACTYKHDHEGCGGYGGATTAAYMMGKGGAARAVPTMAALAWGMASKGMWGKGGKGDWGKGAGGGEWYGGPGGGKGDWGKGFGAGAKGSWGAGGFGKDGAKGLWGPGGGLGKGPDQWWTGWGDHGSAGAGCWGGKEHEKGGKKGWNGIKSQLCKFYPNCQKGEACTFAHSEEELGQQAAPAAAPAAATFGSGGYKGAPPSAGAGYLRPGHSMQALADERKTEWTPEAIAAAAAAAGGGMGPEHRNYKTRMCKFHEQAKCAKGVNCPFAHTPEELRRTEFHA